jgi:hypothetical protein
MAKQKPLKQQSFLLTEEPPAWKKRADENLSQAARSDPKHFARTSDPAPSHAAAKQAVESGQAQGDEAKILEVLLESYEHRRGPWGSLTAKEIALFANWTLIEGNKVKPNNVRVSRRMAAMTSEQIDKKTNQVTRGVLVVVTGERVSFDNPDEPAITSYARIDKCCGQVKNWQRFPLPCKEGEKPMETRVCVCGAALGVGYAGKESPPT